MYSYEIDKILADRHYYYESFYEFEKEIRSNSNQLLYNCIGENDDNCTILDDWTTDGYKWTVYIKHPKYY